MTDKKRTIQEARRIHPPTRMNPTITETARRLLTAAHLNRELKESHEDSFDKIAKATHLANGITKTIREVQGLADEADGETRMRILMAMRALLDSQDSLEEEKNA